MALKIGRDVRRTSQIIIALFFFEALSRCILLAIIPLELLSKLQTLQHVTWFYAAVAIFGLGNSLVVPLIFNKFGGRTVIALSGLLLILAAISISTGSLLGIAFGIICRILGSACVEIPLTTLLMIHVPRDRLGEIEPRRVFILAIAAVPSPWVGLYLRDHVVTNLPFAIAAFAGLILMVLAVIALDTFRGEMRPTTSNHTLYTPYARFFAQPRLRLAWLLVVIRASFWAMFQVYAPIFSIASGWSESMAAGLVSLGNMGVLLVPIWGQLVRRFGMRMILIIGYALGGILLIVTAAATVFFPREAPLVLLAAAMCFTLLDGVGNVIFMRATRPHQRSAATAVFLTYRDFSQLAPNALFALILVFSPLSAAFAVLGTILLAAANLSRSIHPRLR